MPLDLPKLDRNKDRKRLVGSPLPTGWTDNHDELISISGIPYCSGVPRFSYKVEHDLIGTYNFPIYMPKFFTLDEHDFGYKLVIGPHAPEKFGPGPLDGNFFYSVRNINDSIFKGTQLNLRMNTTGFVKDGLL